MTGYRKATLDSRRTFRMAVCFLPLLASVATAQSPTNIFAPAATPAHSIFDLSMLVLSVTLAIFLTVAGLLLYALIRFRQRRGDSNREPAQVYGSNQIELSWTVIPVLIVVMLFLTTARVIIGTQAIPKPKDALNVTVIGHQFWWEYRYPGLGIVTAKAFPWEAWPCALALPLLHAAVNFDRVHGRQRAAADHRMPGSMLPGQVISPTPGTGAGGPVGREPSALRSGRGRRRGRRRGHRRTGRRCGSAPAPESVSPTVCA